MSRAPTWDMALKLQGEMFAAVKAVGGLDVQLVYFRGIGECRASKWVVGSRRARPPHARRRLPRRPDADRQGADHTLDESRRRKVNALVYVGDSMEEDVDRCARVPASWRCSACRCLSSRRAATRRPSAPSAKSRGSPRRLLPLRSRLGAPAARPADRGRRLCCGGPQGAAGAERQGERRRRAPAARSSSTPGAGGSLMLYLILGMAALALGLLAMRDSPGEPGRCRAAHAHRRRRRYRC